MPVAFFDTECYRNYWLLKIRPRGGKVYSFALYAGQSFGESDCSRIEQLFGLFTVVSFNGIRYDVPMIACALAGYNPEQLKYISDRLIVEGAKHWEMGLPQWEPADHIDIMEVLPGEGSQKLYAGRIHYKTMRDLPYHPDTILSPEEIVTIADYCENDLGQIEAEFDALSFQLMQREELSKRYGLDLRSKSDAQMAEAILKHRCERSLGRRIYKPEVDYNLAFRYDAPAFLSFQTPMLRTALTTITEAIFRLSAKGTVELPKSIAGLEIALGSSVYRMGIGGLHSSEKKVIHRADADTILRDVDVASYYPNLIINSGKWPAALGPQFLVEYSGILDERLEDKKLQGKLKKAGDTTSREYFLAMIGNEGGKISVNGTFGKTGSHYSILFAPEMMIQTTLTGQLSLLMLIEWHELNGIPVVSANTDGIVIKCPRSRLGDSEAIVKAWEQRTGLEMEASEYAAIYSRDINNYIAVKTNGEVKRKGEYAPTSLIMKKSPDVEICSDAVAEYLSKGTPIMYTLFSCRDITKFVTIQRVTGGAVKLWGEGPRKEATVKEIAPILTANGWMKALKDTDLSRFRYIEAEPPSYRALWLKDGIAASPRVAYKRCFPPQRPEYLGKVIRWYYGTNAPGSIIYNTNGNTVSLSYGAQPCMTLPDEFPTDIDYDWYLRNCESILRDIGCVEEALARAA